MQLNKNNSFCTLSQVRRLNRDLIAFNLSRLLLGSIAFFVFINKPTIKSHWKNHEMVCHMRKLPPAATSVILTLIGSSCRVRARFTSGILISAALAWYGLRSMSEPEGTRHSGSHPGLPRCTGVPGTLGGLKGPTGGDEGDGCPLPFTAK